jgi:uncharacterized protein
MKDGHMRKINNNQAAEYADILNKALGKHIKQIILFGSHARGDAKEHSDYDVLVIVDRKTKVIRESIIDAGVEMMNRYEKLFAAIVYDEQEWKSMQGFPLAWNINNEGISL